MIDLGYRLKELRAPSVLTGPITDPVPVFLMIMGIMLIAPLLFERMRLPGVVGLILAGVIVGPHGLGLLARDNTIVLLGTVGLLFLMFMAGLETSLDDLKYNADKSVVFGLATFAVPMILGTAAMSLLGYNLSAALLVASCFASHTLLALPIALRLGIMRSQVVTATLGGTLITNILALLVLAVLVKAHQGSLTLGFWLFLFPSLAAYTFITLWGVPRVGRWFFQKFGHDEGAEFTFVLATLFVVSYMAELIAIEPIIGAFLAGIAITQLIPQLSPLMNRIQFIGNTLFVPFFLISVGMLVNPLILVQDSQSLLVSGVMIGVAIVAKYLPAWGSGKLFGLDRAGIMVMFGLSVAQAASTLAAITVAYQIKLVDQVTVNGTIAMILVTCMISPWVTDRWGHNLKSTTARAPAQVISQLGDRVLVPVSNPDTEANLLHLAIILAKSASGTLLPLHILVERGNALSMEARVRQDQLLAAAETMAHAAVTPVESIGRIDDSLDKGITRAAQEKQASAIICGWKGFSTYQENFFGSILDGIIRRATIPVLISRIPEPIKNTGRIVLLITSHQLSGGSLDQSLNLAKTIAAELKASLQILQAEPGSQPNVLPPDLAVKQIGEPFRTRVSAELKQHDLIILVAGEEARIARSSMAYLAENIVRHHPNLGLVMVHFPHL
ncbi:cation:proton antiporter [Leptolyngbya sp. 'hensonii']|nr:cation:proton antiporter [Leptolyngbya sp. 'hensonii']